ncbi:MAG: hypothetical protein HIU57_09165, partial [Acidobacteria bacterium]|nr:hypothetical protein [Acidobacteriota bacterium]
GASVLTSTGQLKVHGSMLWTMLIGFVGFTLLFFWLLRERYRLEVKRDLLLVTTVDEALLQRRREGV